VVAAISALETASLVIALIAALGVSGLVGARLQADRDRQERMRERILDAADQLVGAVLQATDAIHHAHRADGTERADELTRADEAYQRAYALVGRISVLFPPIEGGTVLGHRQAIDLTSALREAIRTVEGSDSIELNSALAEVGKRTAIFARSANALAWSRQIKPRRKTLRQWSRKT